MGKGSVARKIIGVVLLASGVVLFALTAYGSVFDLYQEEGQDRLSAVIKKMDEAHIKASSERAFLEASVEAYATETDYYWPRNRAQVHVADNWILYLMAYVDPLLVSMGLTDVDRLFSAYQSTRYERVLRRGFGICSQHAIGYADLLETRYGIDTSIIGLEGHVVVEANGYLLDPSVGITFPFGLERAEKIQKKNKGMSARYREAFDDDDYTRVIDADGVVESRTAYAELGKFYGSEGNTRVAGVQGYFNKIYWFERVSEALKWMIPVALMLVGTLVLGRPRLYGGRSF